MTMTALPPALERDNGIQIRHGAEITDISDEGVVTVKIIPYDHKIQLIEGLHEVVTRGCFAAAVGNPSRVKIFDQGHDVKTVGSAVEIRDEADGVYGDFKIPGTMLGNDLLMLLRSKTLTEMSAEFRPQAKGSERIRQSDGSTLWRHNRATLLGVSPVAAGAYGDAARLISVRDELGRLSAREKAIAQLSGLVAGSSRA